MRLVTPVLALLAAAGTTGDSKGQDDKDWVTPLASKKFEIRESAKRELIAMGLESLPIVSDILLSANDNACKSTRDVLDRIGPAVIPYLMENLASAHSDTRYYSITVLGNLAPDSAPAVGVLAKALSDPEHRVAYEAAWALAALREHATPAVASLAEALEHPGRLIRTTAAGALAAIGPAARAGISGLLVTLEDEDASTRRAAAEALAAIGLESRPRAVPQLIKALSDENLYVRMSVARAIGTLGPAAKGAVDALSKGLRDPSLAPDAAWALERITGKKPKGVPSASLPAPAPGLVTKPSPPKRGWRMLTGNPQRNAISQEAGIPDDWNVETGKHILWSVPIGTSVYGGPAVADGLVFLGAGNETRHRPGMVEECGTLLAFRASDGKFLWQDHSPSLERQADFLLPSTTSTPLIEGDRLYYVTAQCQLRCLDTQGFRDKENDGPFVTEKDTSEPAADRIWELDIAARLGVFPHESANCSVIACGDVLLVCTSNGVDEAHTGVPAPLAPSFIGVDKRNGAVLWTCAGPGKSVLHGQWSSPSLGRVGDKTLAFFGGGDGWLYALEPATGRVVWRFDGNGKRAVWKTGSDSAGVVRRNSIIACPLFHEGRVYLGLGQDPEHGRGKATLHAIDPGGEGDVSASRRIWTYNDIGRTITTPIASGGMLFAADLNGRVHCIEAKTGRRLWMHDTNAPIWGSVLMIGDELMIGNEDGILLVLRASREKKVLREIELPAPLYSAPAVLDKTLFLATTERLYAIRAAK